MGIVFRQAFLNSILSYIGVLAGFASWVLIIPNIFLPQQVGLLKLIRDLSDFIAKYAQLGTYSITNRFFPFFKDTRKGHNGFLSFVTLLALAGIIIFSLVFVLFRPQILNYFNDDSNLIERYYYLIIPLTFFFLYLDLYSVFATSLLKSVVPTFIRDLAIRLLLLLLLLYQYLNPMPFDNFVYGFIGIFLICFVLAVLYLYYLKELKFTNPMTIWRSKHRKEIFLYGFFTLLGGASSILVRNVDNLMVTSMLGLFNTGIYGVAFLIAVLIEIPKRSMNRILYPLIARAWKDNDVKKIQDYYQKSSLNLMLIGGLLFCGVWCNIDCLLFFLPEDYKGAEMVIFYLGLSRLFDLSMGVNIEIILSSPVYKWNLVYTNAQLVIVVVANLILIPRLGLEGAALATAISVFLVNLINFGFLYVRFKLNPFTRSSIVSLLIIGGTMAVGMSIPYLKNVYLDLVVRSLVITVMYGSLVYLLRVSEDIASRIDPIINRILGRKGK